MTPAEFDTRRRSLGLSVEEAAVVCGGVQDRTVRRWQSGASPIPKDAVDALDELEEAMDRAVEEALAFATDQTPAGPIVLYRYRSTADQARSEHARSLPLGAHAIMIGWLDDALAAAGIETRIEWAA